MVGIAVLLAVWLGLNVAVLSAAYALDRRRTEAAAGGRPAGFLPTVRTLRPR